MTIHNFLTQKKRPIADINVVPYVDVMLVLLVIFMVTAPLLTQGVQVDLPRATAESLPQDQKPPIVVTVNAKGELFLDQNQTPLGTSELMIKVKAALTLDSTRAVLVRGDEQVSYGHVVSAMSLLKRAGVTKVGLMTQSFDEPR